MTQLMMWKRNGVEECGVISKGNNYVLFLEDELMFYYPIKEVTDLQPAKAVPLDAITISKWLWERLQKPYVPVTDFWIGKEEERKGWVNLVLAENPHLIKPEPMMEPTNFAAVVEAHCAKDGNRQKWVLTAQGLWMAKSGWQGNWSNLINPVLISEGVVKP